MNYLAHIYLARHSDRAMLGAMLGDFVRADFAGKYGAEMETEILIHRKVDAYTDSHPVVKAAREKFESGRRRFAGIVLDVFYDHALAQNWSSYCGIPLDDFIGDFYRALLENRALLPRRLAEIVPMIVDENWGRIGISPVSRRRCAEFPDGCRATETYCAMACWMCGKTMHFYVMDSMSFSRS